MKLEYSNKLFYKIKTATIGRAPNIPHQKTEVRIITERAFHSSFSFLNFSLATLIPTSVQSSS